MLQVFNCREWEFLPFLPLLITLFVQVVTVWPFDLITRAAQRDLQRLIRIEQSAIHDYALYASQRVGLLANLLSGLTPLTIVLVLAVITDVRSVPEARVIAILFYAVSAALVIAMFLMSGDDLFEPSGSTPETPPAPFFEKMLWYLLPSTRGAVMNVVVVVLTAVAMFFATVLTLKYTC